MYGEQKNCKKNFFRKIGNLAEFTFLYNLLYYINLYYLYYIFYSILFYYIILYILYYMYYIYHTYYIICSCTMYLFLILHYDYSLDDSVVDHFCNKIAVQHKISFYMDFYKYLKDHGKLVA